MKKEPLNAIPSHLLTLADYEQFAKEFIDFPSYEYISSGAGNELTLSRNQSDFDNITLLPQTLQSFEHAHTDTELLNQTFKSPIALSPVAHHGLVHSEAELATAHAADAVDIPMALSTLSSLSLETVAKHSEAQLWFQLYIQPSMDTNLYLIERAKNAGYKALIVTIDAPVSGLRYRVQRSEFQWPDNLKAANLINYPNQPLTKISPEKSAIFHGLMSTAPTWATLEFLIKESALPVIIKGILNPEDAKKCAAIGAQAIIVSNHGGRVLDSLPSTISILPKIRSAIDKDFPLILDSGIRRGTDVFKALALGADMVMIGRPQLYALAIAGSLGVAHMVQLLQQELEITMALTGCRTINEISSQHICTHQNS